MQTQAEGFNLELPDSQNFAPTQNHVQGTSHLFGTHDNEGLDDDFLQALGDFANEHQAQGTQQAETPHALQQQPQQQHSTQSQQQQLQTQQPPPTPTHAQQQQQQPPQQHQQPQSQATSHPLTEPNTAMQLNFDFDQSFDFDVSSPSDVLPI
jgi:hypothetical protein